jgi:hypothetical protein
MKLVMTLLVRDEIDIIRENIEFHLNTGVDYVIAMDNLSVDGTTEVLRGYEALGLLHYIPQTDDTYSQHRWVTQMAHLAASAHGADWVINNDADEFWFPNKGNLKSALADVSGDVFAMYAPRVNFLPPQGAGESSFYERMLIREKSSFNALGFPLPGKTCHRGRADITVDQGNHCVRRAGEVLAAGGLDATILHFPMRSYAQFANKIAKGGAAYARNQELPPGIGDVWRVLYEDWRADALEKRYAAAQLSPQFIEQGLAGGDFLVDARVRDVLSMLPPRPLPMSQGA